MKKCSICKGKIEPLKHPTTNEVVWTDGNNAEPVNSGRCCDVCNYQVVVPIRIKEHFAREGVK